jgi:hypothetical protein
MKSARILVIGLMSLLIGYGVIATLRAWGQEGRPLTAGVDLPPGQLSLYSGGSDAEMDKLLQEEAAAEHQVHQLVESYAHRESETERGKIRGNLATALQKEFDLQQKRRDLELARIEARVKKVRDLMQKRSDARQSIIEKRLDQLLREAEGLGWTPPAGINVPQLQDGQRLYRNNKSLKQN